MNLTFGTRGEASRAGRFLAVAAMAVASVISAAALTAPEVAGASPSAATWSPVSVITTAGGTDYLNGVSCTAVGTCTAAGVNGYDQPMVVSENSGVWGQPAQISASGNATFNAISCAGATECTAVGKDVNGPIVSTETAGIWGSAVELSAPGGGGSLTSISCTAAGTCTAAGVDGNSQPFAIAASAGAWGSPNEITATGSASFASISCPDASDCTAVGTDANGPIVATETAGVWGSSVELTTVSGGQLGGISCTDATDCTAVGHAGGPMAISEIAGVWGTATSIAAPGGGGWLYSVSCTDASECNAVGLDWNGQPFAATETAGVWQPGVEIPATGYAELVGVSCTAVTDCAAVGSDGTGHAMVTTLAPTATAPVAPTGVTATPGNASASVSFTPPSDGFSPITGYTVTATDLTEPLVAPQIDTGAASPITATGLINGDSYSFTVTATNAIGTSPSSQASAAVTPATTPSQMAPPTLGVGNATLTVSWTPPVSTGGSAITSYQVMVWGVAYSFSASTTSHTFTADPSNGSITNGNWYHPVVAATNAVGQSVYSLQPTQVFPGFIPLAPASVTATAASSTSAKVSWPFSVTSSGNGGWNVTNYIVTVATDGGTILQTINTGSGSIHVLTVSGLAPGQDYIFTVVAVSANGTSAPSVAPPTLIGAAPGAVTGLTANAGTKKVVLSWNPAASNGASVTYQVIEHQGSTTTSFSTTATTLTVTGLVTGTSYSFGVQATNTFGSSAVATSSAVKAL